MIVWGGNGVGQELGDGACYNPNNDTWTSISTIGAPSGRFYFPPIWTGNEMIVWGGNAGGILSVGDGARFNPIANKWTSITTDGVPSARNVHSGVWTGDRMIIWGGTSKNYLGSPEGVLNDTYSYNFGLPRTFTIVVQAVNHAPS